MGENRKMSKILISVPCLYNADCCSQSIQSVLNRHGIDLLLMDNGSDQNVKNVLEKFKEYDNVKVIHEPINIYVNPAWDKFINYFLDHTEYDHLVLMNSDLILGHDFHHVIKTIWKTFPEHILVPEIVDRDILKEKVPLDIYTFQQIHSGIAGVFITLSQRQAMLISPLPPEIKIWHGDEYIYNILNAIGEAIVIPSNLRAHHVGSETVKRLPGLQEILTQDKENWTTIVKPKMEEKIKQLKNGIY